MLHELIHDFGFFKMEEYGFIGKPLYTRTYTEMYTYTSTMTRMDTPSDTSEPLGYLKTNNQKPSLSKDNADDDVVISPITFWATILLRGHSQTHRLCPRPAGAAGTFLARCVRINGREEKGR